MFNRLDFFINLPSSFDYCESRLSKRSTFKQILEKEEATAIIVRKEHEDIKYKKRSNKLCGLKAWKLKSFSHFFPKTKSL